MKNSTSKCGLVTVLAAVLFFNASALANYSCTIPMLSLVAVSSLCGVSFGCFAIVRCYQLKRGTTPQTQAFLADQTQTQERVNERERVTICSFGGLVLIFWSLFHTSACILREQ